jgi:hypothetical protein
MLRMQCASVPDKTDSQTIGVRVGESKVHRIAPRKARRQQWQLSARKAANHWRREGFFHGLGGFDANTEGSRPCLRRPDFQTSDISNVNAIPKTVEFLR